LEEAQLFGNGKYSEEKDLMDESPVKGVFSNNGNKEASFLFYLKVLE
jgi:hypothetical protein